MVKNILGSIRISMKKNLKIKETFALAFKHHKKNDLKVAKNLYKSILKLYPNHFETIYLLGSLSLQTKNLEQAKEKAKSIYYKMMGQVEIGKKIFSISAQELVDRYTKHQQQRVDGGFITAGRFTTIKTQLKHFLDFAWIFFTKLFPPLGIIIST